MELASVTDEELQAFTEALTKGGTLHLPPRLYAQLQALPGGAVAVLPPGIKVVESSLLGPDEMVVTAPPEPIRLFPMDPPNDPTAGVDALWLRSDRGALYPKGTPEREEFDARQQQEGERLLDAMLLSSICRLEGL